MNAQPTNDVVVRDFQKLPNGEICLIVPCYGYEHYESLPLVVTLLGLRYGKTGWNSDNGEAYYRTDAIIAVAA